MNRRRYFSPTLALVAAVALGCAKAPQEDVGAAQSEIDRARQAQADVWAPNEFQAADQAMSAARGITSGKYPNAEVVQVDARQWVSFRSDGTYTQIIKGLNAGDQVIVEVSTGTSDDQGMMMGPGGMDMGGGAPPAPPSARSVARWRRSPPPSSAP